jgi:hypothetical protein
MLIAAVSGITAFLAFYLLLSAVATHRKRSRAVRRPPPASIGWRPNPEKVRRIERQLAAGARAKTPRKTAEE